TYANKGVGFPEDGFLKAVETVAGSDFHEIYDALVQSRRDLDYNRYLKQAGLVAAVQLQPGTICVGLEFDPRDGNFPPVRRDVPDSPAARARLGSCDLL